jgi:ssDNA-binding replication factor A large subunit
MEYLNFKGPILRIPNKKELSYRAGMDDMREITTKAGRQSKKRDIQLTDTSDSQISVTVWGPKAEEFGTIDIVGKVVRIRGSTVSEFNGKSLSLSFNSTVEVGPDCPEANVLLEWWNRRSANHQNGNGSLNNLSK